MSIKNVSRRDFLKVTGLGLGGATLAACAPAEPAASVAPAAAATAEPAATIAPAATVAPAATEPAKEPITIRYGRHDPADGIVATIKAFEEANPGIKIAVEQVGEFPEKIPAMAAAGTLPDVVRSWEAMVLELGRSSQFIDVQSFVDTTSDFHSEDFYENWWNYPVAEGKRFGIPDAIAPHVTYYNAKLFDEKAVEYPDPKNFTWTDFEEKARAVSDPDNKIWGSETIPVGWHYYSLKQVWQNGGDFYSPDYKTSMVDTPETIEAIDYWAGLLLDGNVMPTPSQIAGIGGEGAAAELMSAGKLGMQRMGSWITGGLIEAGIKFNIVPEPSKARRDTITHGAFNAISGSSEHKNEAWQWINANCSTEGIYNYCSVAKFPGARRTTNKMEPKPWIAQVDWDVNWDVIPQALEYGHVLPGPCRELEALKVIGDALQTIYSGDAKAADLFPEISPKVTKILQDC